IASGLIDCYSSKHCWHKYPGTLELLDSLHGRRDLVLGVVSNFDERLGIVLDSTGLRSYFAFVLTSYGFGIQKPSPAIFQEALRLASLGLSREIRPEEAVHVGDRLDNDFLGARGAGWNAVLIDRDGKNEEDQRLGSRDVVVDFRGLKEYFDRLFDKKAVCDR
ncbi:rhythmically expressed gene 2 protein-like, partial [Copidosoma floridanum]